MSAARTDWQAILASFADEIQPLLSVVASSLDRLVEQPGDALAATTALAQLQTLQASASMMSVDGFEALLETSRAALETVTHGGPLTPAQQAAGRELGDLLVREGEAIGQGEPAPAPPPRAAQLLLVLRGEASGGATALARSAATGVDASVSATARNRAAASDELESWLDTLLLEPEFAAEPAAPTVEPAATAAPIAATGDEMDLAESATASGEAVEVFAWAPSLDETTDEPASAAANASAIDDTDELPRPADWPAAEPWASVQEAAITDGDERLSAAAWCDGSEVVSDVVGEDALAAESSLAEPVLESITAEPAADSSGLDSLLASLEEVAREPIAATDGVEATVAWHSAADDMTVEMAPVDLDALLGTLGTGEPAEPAEPPSPFAASVPLGEVESADRFSHEPVPGLAADVAPTETWEASTSGTTPVSDADALPLAAASWAEHALASADSVNTTMASADLSASGDQARLAVDELGVVDTVAEAATTYEQGPPDEPSAVAPSDDALAELLASLSEVTGQPLSEADRAELVTAWHEEPAEAIAEAGAAANPAADEALAEPETALALDDVLSTLDADDEPFLDTATEPLVAAALATEITPEPLELAQRVAITAFMTKWADALESDADVLERYVPASTADVGAHSIEARQVAEPRITPYDHVPSHGGGDIGPDDGAWLAAESKPEQPEIDVLSGAASENVQTPAVGEETDIVPEVPFDEGGTMDAAAGAAPSLTGSTVEHEAHLDDPELMDLLATLDVDPDEVTVDAAAPEVVAVEQPVSGFCETSEIERYLSEPSRQVAAWATEPAAVSERVTPAGADEPEALAVFAAERVRLVEAVAEARAALEAAPDDEMALTDLTWATHTLRGAASLVGAEAISEVCGLVERALEQHGAQPLPLAPDALMFLATAEAVLRELLDASAGAEDMVALVTTQFEALQGPTDQAPSAPIDAGWGDLPPELAAQLDGVDVTELDEATLAQLAEALAAHDAAREAAAASSANSEPVTPDALPDLIDDNLTSPWALPTALGDAPLADPLGFAGDADFEAELRATFLGEAEEHLTTINGALLALEANPGDAARLIAVRRAVHTLKSASAVVGLDAVSTFCHVWEDALECVEEDTGASPPELSLLLECAEALERYFRDVSADASAAETAFVALTDRLREAAGTAPEAAPQASLAADYEPEESQTIPTSGAILGLTEPEPADESEESAPATRATAEPAASAEMLRVPLGRVDGMIDLVGELVLQRSGLVQRLEALRLGVDDLAPSLERLRRLGAELEDRFVASGEPRGLARRQSGTTGTTGSAAEFDELEFDRYNAANLLARELSELAADLATTRRELGHLVEDARLAVTRQGRTTTDLHDDLLDARLVPLSQLTLRLQRTVRQVALKSGKEVTFALEGGDTLLDKTLLEQIADPLLHLLRNAVDHGIESADERVARGKTPTGAVRVVANRDGHEVVIQVCDDGAGIDTARVLAQARTRGLIADDTADTALAHELIFAPGLSTSRTLTDVSGRGIGLDAVRAHLARAKGTVSVSSTLGEGTVFTLRLPSLLVVTPSLVVAAHGQRLALPLAQVRHVLRVPHEQVLVVGDTRLLPLDGENVRIRSLGGLLGWPAVDDAPRATVLLVVVAVGERQVALEVDDVFGQQETVVKTPAPPFDVLPGLAGASVQGNGEVLLVLNLLELVSEPGGRPRGVPLPPPPAGVLEPPTVLVVDDSLSVRRVVVRALERHGWRAHEARDGVHALEVLRRVSPDVVLLDIEMPRMDGYELAGILKKQDTFQGIPIVMLTSRGGEKHRRKAFEIGVDAYLVKPYQEAELLRILRQVALAVPQVVA